MQLAGLVSDERVNPVGANFQSGPSACAVTVMKTDIRATIMTRAPSLLALGISVGCAMSSPLSRCGERRFGYVFGDGRGAIISRLL